MAGRLPTLIVGGGIGGLATALALARRGRPVHVVEKSPEFGELGAGLQLAPNAMAVLDRLGVAGALAAHAVHPRRLVWMDALSAERITEIKQLVAAGRRIDAVKRYQEAGHVDLTTAMQVIDALDP